MTGTGDTYSIRLIFYIIADSSNRLFSNINSSSGDMYSLEAQDISELNTLISMNDL